MPDYQLSATIIGASELKYAVSHVQGVAAKALKDAMNKSAINMQGLAKQKAPHRKGGLKESIHNEPAVITSTNVIAKVGTNLKYARAQEYGTKGMTIHSHSKLGTPFTYLGNIPPKYYFRDARQEVTPLMVNHMRAAIKIILDSLMTKGVM